MEKTLKASNIYFCQELFSWMYLSALVNPVWNNEKEFSKAFQRQLQQNFPQFCFPFICNTSQNRVSISWIWMLNQIRDPQGNWDSHSLENFRGFTTFGRIVILKLFFVNCLTCFKGGLTISQFRRLFGILQGEGENRAIRGSECTYYTLPFWSAPSFK